MLYDWAVEFACAIFDEYELQVVRLPSRAALAWAARSLEELELHFCLIRVEQVDTQVDIEDPHSWRYAANAAVTEPIYRATLEQLC